MEEDDEPSKTIPKWVELEYKHMQDLARPKFEVHFTHLSQKSCSTLQNLFSSRPDSDGSSKNAEPKAQAFARSESVLELMKARNVPLDE
ncbi:unnamed protein product [Somion occarium]|uniref:Uncharacterized protein n=1 Tax=Somion occarium TaxID=3059160 RepID=A0ABP1DQJ9_9APHY